MIEVEKKFILSDDDIKRLTEDAEFVSEKTFTDVYYDTADYALTTKDQWLRRRGERFELKRPILHNGQRAAHTYEELETENAIGAALNLVGGDSFAATLGTNGFHPFATIITTRRKYKAGDFTIDLDTADLGGYIHQIGEIELMVSDVSQAQDAADRIITFAKSKDLKIAYVRGKLAEYIKRYKPDQYRLLVAAGVLKDL